MSLGVAYFITKIEGKKRERIQIDLGI